MARLLLHVIPDGEPGLETLLAAPAAEAPAQAPGPAAVLPLRLHLQQMLAPARAPSQAPAAFNNTPPLTLALGPASVPNTSPAAHTIFIASWVSILAAVGIIFLICAVIMASKVFRSPSQGPFGITIPGRSAETVEGAIVPTALAPAENGKPGSRESPPVHRVLVQLPNNDICCGVELTAQDKGGPKPSN